MARRSAEVSDRRIAVVGAASATGALVKSALADHGVAGSRVALFGASSEVAVLSEYDGEARLVQPVAELDARAHAAVFVCEPGHDLAPLTQAASEGTLIVDLSGSLDGTALTGAGSEESSTRLLAVAHPIAGALAAILAPLHAALVVERASALVLRPAADFGEAGLDELREQTIRLLRFERTPTDVFGRQVAFNVVPDHLLPGEEADATERIVAECRALLGTPDLPLHLSTALVPIFLGHAVALHAELARGGAAEAARALSGARGVRIEDGEDAGCTMDALEGSGVSVAHLATTGPRSLRLWATVADAGRAAASRAIEVADAAGVL